ncbi:CidA/LrgA family protein [Halomonas sp. TBZ9]|uniref:CidA/LrgA family protein n=1 Tax=Vreelandella azerica TaxID=2732867 RepID=A0A7Y3TW81_9GAMM|nr:CidA/LrgA family protein [Halomonas azerica]NOG31397.1 CidA/LrgA family protein [Halomonas azerica]
MTALGGFLWLVSFWLIGEVIVYLTAIPVSSGVLGMLLLSITLALRGGVPDTLAAAAQPLIALLAMLIMPGVVGVFFVAGELGGQWVAIIVSLMLGTLLSVLTTLWLMRHLMRGQNVK